MQNKILVGSLIFGFALFSAFFGAGNLIFPPSIGLSSGISWGESLFAFSLSGILLPVLSFVAVYRVGGMQEVFAKDMGRLFALTFSSLIMVVAVLIVIPRTAATTYEVAVLPLFGSGVPNYVSSFIYFSFTLYFAFNPSDAMEKLGKYLTPFLLLVLTFIVLKGIIYPISLPIDKGLTDVFKKGFLDGYQTFDVLGGIIFSGGIVTAIYQYGFQGKDASKVLFGSAFVTLFGLAFVYGGLLYIGATASGVVPSGMEKTALLTKLLETLLPSLGHYAMAAAVALACVTSAIGGITSVSQYFDRISNGKLAYKPTAILFCVLGFSFSIFKVEQIITFAIPFLVISYPLAITLTCLGLFKPSFPKLINKGTYIGAGYTTLVLATLDALPMFGIQSEAILSFSQSLPLYAYALFWSLPAMVAGLIGSIAYQLCVKSCDE